MHNPEKPTGAASSVVKKIFASASELAHGPLVGRRADEVLVFTKGVFDHLHVGHLESFEAARSLGDALVVAVSSDQVVRRRKGPGRPIMTASERMRVVAALECVTWVVPYDEESPYQPLLTLKPDIFVASHFDSLREDERADLGGGALELRTVPKRSGTSTTAIVSAIIQTANIADDRPPKHAQATGDAGTKG
jgi:D-beta-D-heptose 7-phosphate kinase/D-beta-D-heptose 1-phosphate adenosyltransferase